MNLSAVKSPTLLLALSALFSRLLGVWRDHLLAKTFGAGASGGIYNLDAYYAAFRIPDLLYNLLIFGAVSAAFIPLFTQYKKQGQLKRAWEFASNMMHFLLLAMLGFCLLAYVLSPWLAHLVAPGFGLEETEFTARLMRILLLSPLFFTISAVFISLQDSFKTFFYRSLAPLFYNAGIVLGILFFGQKYGVVGVTWGVILGATLQLLIQLPALRQIGFRHVWILDRKRQDVQEAFRLIVPRVLGLSLNQLTLLLNTVLASFLATGSMTIFYLADNLQNLPLGMVGIAFAITSFATLSEMAAEKDGSLFALEIRRVMQKILFLIIPATLGLWLLRAEIIDLILVGGQFTVADGMLVSRTLVFFLLSLFAQSLIPVLARGFYAYHNTRTPLWAAFAGAILSVCAAWFLSIYMKWGVPGIAAGFSAGITLNALILYRSLSLHCGSSLLNWKAIGKILFCGAIMLGATWLLKHQLTYEGNFWQKLFFLLFITATGALVYFLLAKLLAIEENK